MDTKTLTAGNDTFDATNLTFGSNDIIDGAAGSDILNITNNGTAALTLPAAVVSNVETINVRNLASSSLASGAAEVATVTVGALKAGQTITVAGQTVLATADLAEAAVATALASAASATGYVLSGTITTGWGKAAGTNADQVLYTATTVGDKQNLTLTGNAGSNLQQVSTITVGGTVVSTDTTTFTYNGATVVTAAHGATTAASVAGVLATAINSYAGKVIAKAAGDVVQVMSDTPVSLAGFDATGSTATTYVNALAPSVQTLTVGGTAIVADATISFTINGTVVTTAAVPAVPADDDDANAFVIAAAINDYYGATIATVGATTNAHIVTVNSGKVGLAIGGFTASAGTSTVALSVTTVSSGIATTDAPVISITNGTAETAAATHATTVDATKFANATTFNSDLSTANVIVSNVAKDQVVGMKGNGTVATGGLDATYGSTVTAATVNLTGGTNGGAVALTASAATTVSLTSTGAPLTSTGLTGTNTVASLNIGGTTTSTLNIVADSNLTTGTGAVTLTAKTLNISGAATSVILDSDTALSASNLTTIDASGMTVGGVTLGLVAGITSFKGGQGADTVTTAGIATGSVVDAGVGGDTLIIGSAGDVDTAAKGARYLSFETVRAASGSYDASLVSSATAIQMTGAGTLSNLNATQAGNVQIRNSGQYTASLITETGTSDVLTMKLGTGSSASAATSITTGLTANGFETINLATNHGSTAATGSDRTSTIAAFTADSVTAINLTGSAFTITNPATTKKVTIDASALVGNGATTPVGLTVNSTGNLVNGSTVIGSAERDSYTIAAEGSTFNGGGGDDQFVIVSTGPAALTAADGVTDLVLDGGANSTSTTTGKDVLEFADSTITDDLTLTDANFTKISGMESLKLSNTGSLSLTTGSAFNATFADGVKITTGALVDAKTFTLNGGLSTTAIDLTVDGALLVGNAATEDITIRTGTANDKVTFTGTVFVGAAAGDGATITVATGDGDDTISITTGTIVDDSDNQAIIITGGKGKDTITMVKVNGGDTGAAGSQVHLGNAQIIMADGDSTTANYDVIVGFDAGATTDIADNLDFAGSSNAVSAFSTQLISEQS